LVEKEFFEKDRHECWNTILSVSANNMDDKAIPQFQQLALETKGRFYKTKTPDEIADRLMDIGNSLATTSAGGGLDIVFVVDNTGSMGDSIEVVKGKIREFITASKGKYAQIRYGLVQYRDAGDDFVTRVTPFTTDTAAFESAVSAMSAQGGGDWPEAMLDAIYAAATKLQWLSQRRVMILLGDAPGHEKVVEAPSSVTWTNIIPTLRGSGIEIQVYSVYSTLEIAF
jgi:Mg-chelatase subunit ChlD